LFVKLETFITFQIFIFYGFKLVDKSLDRRIAEVLRNHGELTLPMLAKILDSNVGTIDYHLKKLEEKGIIKVKRKKYGTKYSLNRDVVSANIRTVVQFVFSFVFTVIGFLLIFRFDFVYAALFLSVPSVIGTVLAIEKFRYELKGKLDKLLKELE